MPSSNASGQVRIGISGWRYEPWRDVFYPSDLPQRRELEYASRQLSSIEINGSFYSLQRPAYYAQWRDEVPDDFVFSVKGPRYITHIRRLKEVEEPLANFLASGVLALGAKLGPILWQCPPMLPFDAERLDAFFKLLPHDTEAAAALAKHHGPRLSDWALTATDKRRPLRHAVEVRHPSFADPAFITLLRRHRIALVMADTAKESGRDWPRLEDLTADFVYMRLHGDQQLYASGYTDEALDRWAQRIDTWRHGRQVADAETASDRPAPKRARRDVFCYFDNDVKVHAPFDAAALMKRLGQASPLAEHRHPKLPADWQVPEPRRKPTATRRSAPRTAPGSTRTPAR